jgi:hypothetical protein
MSLGTESALFSASTLAANGSTAAMVLPSTGLNVVEVYLGAGATFGSGTITIQMTTDGGTTWVTSPLGTATFNSGTANTFVGRFLVYGPQVRFTLAGATSPSLDIRAVAKEVREPRAIAASSPNGGSIGAPAVWSFSANATTPIFTVPSNEQSLVTDMLVVASGTWGSGTLTLQTSPDGGATWFNAAAGITANGVIAFGSPLVVPQATAALTQRLFRLVLSGATSPSLAVRAIV